MVRLRRLLIGIVAVLSFLLLPLPAFAGGSGCAPFEVLAGACSTTSATNNGTDVTLDGRATGPGDSSGSGSGTGGGAGAGGNGSGPALGTPAVVRDNYTITMPVTLADLARFRPNPGVDLMEPDGWMIVGLSTNFYAHASRHIKEGTLLGGPASVRFTPAQYSWDYGDGATRTTSTPGDTWAALGIAEFDATQTSHIYHAPGYYVIELTIGYAPEYRLGASETWIPVRGLVWGPANPLEAVAARSAKTVLVEEECNANPGGPGC